MKDDVATKIMTNGPCIIHAVQEIAAGRNNSGAEVLDQPLLLQILVRLAVVHVALFVL